jgi:hemerythrin-like domain-containing protein
MAVKIKPYGPLMAEHRIIEQIAGVMKAEVARINKEKRIDPHFINATAAFLRTYADRCHHGKEEDILFAALKRKKISKQHFETLQQLLEEHEIARKNVRDMLAAKERYVRGDRSALSDIKSCLSRLAALYPAHIELEDRHFFIEVMQYFSEREQNRMVKDFWEFDRKIIHSEYKDKVVRLKEEIGR